MDILVALKQEEGELQQKLRRIQGAIAALNGAHYASPRAQTVGHVRVRRRRTMSAVARAKISKAAKERWAKFRVEKAKKAK
jgi:hypothetical protein